MPKIEDIEIKNHVSRGCLDADDPLLDRDLAVWGPRAGRYDAAPMDV